MTTTTSHGTVTVAPNTSTGYTTLRLGLWSVCVYAGLGLAAHGRLGVHRPGDARDDRLHCDRLVSARAQRPRHRGGQREQPHQGDDDEREQPGAHAHRGPDLVGPWSVFARRHG